MPYAMMDFSIAVVDSLIYLIGGSGGPSDSSVMAAYNPITESWTQKTNMPTGRGMLSACVIDGKIYAIGGTTADWENVFYKHVEVYDPVTDTWTQKADMPTGRWGLAACSLNGLIYAIGGRAGTNSSSKVEVYNPVADTWTTKTRLQRSRTTLVAGVVENKIYAIGGHVSPNYTILSSVEEYTPDATGIDSESNFSSTPNEFQLYQNYPNPFNSNTTIRYSLNKPNFVCLEIYNVQGERIVNAVNEFKKAGNYSYSLNTNQYSSSILFYKLQLGNQVSETKKMLHLK
ncbi:T9SS type A sorting domain-containing protein [candidate division KSB1 bacterium]|nr:T9SS type A sorting domain-containing protein [candidate division KSB1 bacterium]